MMCVELLDVEYWEDEWDEQVFVVEQGLYGFVLEQCWQYDVEYFYDEDICEFEDDCYLGYCVLVVVVGEYQCECCEDVYDGGECGQ